MQTCWPWQVCLPYWQCTRSYRPQRTHAQQMRSYNEATNVGFNQVLILTGRHVGSPKHNKLVENASHTTLDCILTAQRNR
jgi:hypothetical protein